MTQQTHQRCVVRVLARTSFLLPVLLGIGCWHDPAVVTPDVIAIASAVVGAVRDALGPILFSRVTLASLALFVVRFLVLTAIEKRSPAHSVSYPEVFPKDIYATVVFVLCVLPVANFLDRWIAFRPVLPQSVLEWPLAIRCVCYLVLADFGYYWMHRMLHTRYLWRAHKWHHYPKYMYWLAGVRGSVLEQALVNLPYIAAGVFLQFSPAWIFWANLFLTVAQNDIMHLNVWWGNRWLEWFILTPRYHHIHHSDNPAHHGANYAALFPIWDHAFGTYIDPEQVSRDLTFGIGEPVPVLGMIIGV